ncbi:hypothetical protein GCM10009836_57780 [Pseudonocardia ailaonensis]|uniref:Class II aldolase/adducin N-terminal domain-containing protein n=1 Tax=Pseudonocardia ailaonensis TaxID=367279 RepID=A0ABN2NJ53_9PSEU
MMTTEAAVKQRLSPSAARAAQLAHLALTPRQEIVLLARALYREGWDDFEVGHITYRLPDDTFLTLPFERGWDEVRPEEILRIDIDGNVLEGDFSVTGAIVLHLEFHRLRPECDVTVHQHPRFTTVWSAIGKVPPAYDQRAAYLPDDQIAFYDDYSGGVNSVDEARAAVNALGDRSCAILRNHGAFVVANSIAQAFGRATSLEWRCQQAWHVEAAGGGHEMPQKGRDWLAQAIAVGCDGALPHQWPWAVRRELRADPALLQGEGIA